MTINDIDRSKLSQMMQHYVQTREEYPDCILFYRLGDFYELFFDDAELVSRELELTLTGKECGLDERAPMCGVPFHAVSIYISRLIEKGYKIAICEQTEDPKHARENKKMVDREVVEIVTPGTISDTSILDERKNNFLCVVYAYLGKYGIGFADISTGEMHITETENAATVIDEIASFNPVEIIANEPACKACSDEVSTRQHLKMQSFTESFFENDAPERYISQYYSSSVAYTLPLDKPAAIFAACAILRYFEHTRKGVLKFLKAIDFYSVNEYMALDAATRRNLEIIETMRDKNKRGSLLWTIDFTKTSMGARNLKQWIEKPLLNTVAIKSRLDAVEELTANPMSRDDLGDALDGIYDVSRITSRMAQNKCGPREIVALKNSLVKIPSIKSILNGLKSDMYATLQLELDPCDDISAFIDSAINDEDTPVFVKDGNVIKSGFNAELDDYRNAMNNSTGLLAAIETEEREKTGIKNLRVKYNKVFGYYIEVTNSFLSLVPDYFVRKQTLTGAERFITDELKQLEDKILGATEKSLALEAKLFGEVAQKVAGELARLNKLCFAISTLDSLYSLATAAIKNHFTKPTVANDGKIEIKDGRHPVVEKLSHDLFVPNDTMLDLDENRMVLITGPNMAGKSTYMRQVAVITLLAQMGSFVPAASAHIGVCDKIFTRVGASDDIASGQSTFMVEMTEVANILTNATEHSLLIFDEIGRGTSTYDGLAIAWSVIDYVQSKKCLGAKTLFATHYHELVQLEDRMDGVKNYNIAVKKHGDKITFLRKIVRGGTDDSYGIDVAALAGVPPTVIKRARKILASIEAGDISNAEKQTKRDEEPTAQMSFGDAGAINIVNEMKMIDATTLTPIEAMTKLYELCEKAKNI